ncbi:MAG: cation-transporting P-type ATPase, partial [Planctomycetes bacterium]|nr:cation-transporting P-type ATPase [Planctomycetota bacterium]
GLRVLALATKGLDSVAAEARSGLVFLGAVGLLDPPRRDVAAAIAACQGAGIRVVMVTGDLAATGAYVAREVGILREGEEVISGRELAELSDEELRRRLPRTSVFARVTPADKLRIVRAFQEEGEVVAVFGDGVNDAPALKQADIGVVMGQRGTQVAKEAGDLILQDDRLPTIVSAVEGGRVIFRNLRKFVVYLLSCNIAEVMLILAASLIRMPMPLKPLQILWLNLVTDVFPALALGMERYAGNVMAEEPRPAWEPFLGRTQYRGILGYGSLIAVCTLGAFMGARWWLGLGLGESITVAFFSLALAQVFFVLKVKAERGLRDPRGIFTNKWVWLSVGWCGVLSVGSVFVPGLKQVLRVEMLP